ncbi:ABC transporter permease [Alteriqipengyuania sp. NZ-12B]|uniref:ABC transporter permease n=1 Tax=Alteriqipengyuania abyssalis TaxID=2860200 RepID=A0ABS7PF27_9SPHN|nr:ABC transporter permease [Alteriqipengyuania abyssalis]MBY8337674.1 ABC transporter permease [Alteriqipengyuania abyssalis]
MNRFALLSLYRSLTRHKLYAALNIGGLAIGIAVFIVLGLYVRFETSYDRWIPDHENLYMVQSDFNLPGSPFDGVSYQTPWALLDMLKETDPELVGTNIMPAYGSVIRDGAGTAENIAPADPGFLDFFRLELAAGSRDALKSPRNAVLTEAAAERYFPSGDPIGQTITLSHDEGPTNYTVGAVVRDLPANTQFDFSILIPIVQSTSPTIIAEERNLGALTALTYVRLETAADVQGFLEKMPAFIRQHGDGIGENPDEMLSYVVEPIADFHLGTADSLRQTVATLGIVGLVTLLIALTNYINLATARAGLRAREVAMRKVLGADRSKVMRQFMGEAILTVAIASLGGLILAELGLPFVNATGGLSLDIPYALVVPALVVLAIVAGALAGFYPAMVVSRFQPAAVLASSRSPGGGRGGARVREALVVFQFGLSIAFMIGTAVMMAQTSYIRNADLGFEREGLLVLSTFNDPGLDDAAKGTLMARFREIPQVTSVTAATMAVGGSGSNTGENMELPGVPGPGPSVRKIDIGDKFFETYGIRTVAGRVFSSEFGRDDATETEDEGNFNIVINRNAVPVMGFDSPEDAIGKVVGGDRPRTIVGVVDNVRYTSARAEIGPTFYVYKSELPDFAIATLRFTGDPRPVKEAVRAAWQESAGALPLGMETTDERLETFYEDDERTARLFAIGAGLAVLIGMVGLWGLASFNTARRVKEIGIRKSLGASATDIVKLLVGQFMRPVLIANLIAWPLAYFAMRTWLAGFDDRITLSPLFFIGASLVAIAIAVLTVLGQSLRASRTAPAWALRHD